MDPVSCLYNFLSIGILCYFVIICFLIKKCCMNCGTNCAAEDENLCKCYQKIYEGEITPSNHVIVRDGNERLPISYLLNQQEDNEGEYVLGEDGVLYRNEACKECCVGDDISRSSCNSREDVFVIRASRGKEDCTPCSPSALGLGEGSFKRTASGRSVPTGISAGNSLYSPIKSINGSPQNLSDVSELKGVVSYGGGGQSLLDGNQQSSHAGGHDPTTKRSSQVVDFHAEPSEHVFTVEGSVGSSQASANVARTSITSCGSPGSHTSRTSCGSRITSKSGGSIGSRKSCISTCPSTKSNKSSPTLASVRIAESHLSGGPLEKTAGIGSPTSKSGSACSSLGKPCPSSGSIKKSKASDSPSQTQSIKGVADVASVHGASLYGTNADGTSAYGGSIYGPDGASMIGSTAGGVSVQGSTAGGASVPGSIAGVASIYEAGSQRGSPGGYETDSRRAYMGEVASHASTRRGFDGERTYDESPSEKGIPSQPGTDTCGSGAKSGTCGSGGGKSGKSAKSDDRDDANKSSKSNSCVSPCGTIGSRSIKKSKSSSFKPPCGSPGSPCPNKNSKSARGASPAPSRRADYGRDGSPSARGAAPRKVEYAADTNPSSPRRGECGRGASPSSPRRNNTCSGSASTGSPYTSDAQSPIISPSSKSDRSSPYSTGAISPVSSPSAPNQRTGSRCTKDVCVSGLLDKRKVEKLPSPILKNPDESPSPPRDGVASPRVSIKANFDIISPEGITSAPTFGKDECNPCPYLDNSEVSSGGAETGSCSSNRRNDILSDEYKDDISNKRKADKISADYKDSADNSRGTKSARFSDHCNSGTCSSKASSATKSCSKCSKGNKSWPSSSSQPSSSVTTDYSTTKGSSATDASSISSSTKTKSCINSATNSLCETTCKTKSTGNSSYLNSPNAKSNYPSVTTADIDDFREISPHRSRCENLGSALARSTCGEIIKAREQATCEAIKDPSKDVICNNTSTDPGTECSAIRALMENPNCPSLLKIIEIVDEVADENQDGTQRKAGTSASPGSPGYSQNNRPGTSGTVDAAVIHEISTKVQSCLQHARAIASKVGGGGGGGGAAECRKTMRVKAKNANASSNAQSVKVNSNITLNTKGITINEYNKVDKPFGKCPGIQVKMKNKQGNVEQFKKPYAELLTADGGTINIRIRSPCKSTPGKLLCVSTNNNRCCSDSTTNNNTSSTQPTTSSQGRKVAYAETSEDEDQDENQNYRSQPDSQEYSSQDDNETTNDKSAVVVYKRPSKQQNAASKEKSSKGECSPDCVNCKRKTCPTSKYYKGRKKQGKLQVYNVTTSHFSQLNHSFRSPYVKGMPIIDARIYEQYTHPERYRAGETYLKRRREMIQKIKGKCPWM